MTRQGVTGKEEESEPDLQHRVLKKTTRRLIPFLILLYTVAYLDRVNVGFAQLQMKSAVGFSDAVYGLGAGIFFLGYFLFEVPSNLILQRVGARIWIARIMMTWGLIAMAMIWVQTPRSFYLLRFLLGISEAGFFPGIIFYMTCWFPAAASARAMALFLTATAMAGVVGGPVSGLLLSMNGAWGLAGWQWLFLVEGLPAVLLGFLVLRYLTDQPEQASWLTSEERQWLARQLEGERKQKEGRTKGTLSQTLASGRVWLFSLIYFLLVIAFYGVGLWLPQVIKGSSGLTDLRVGMISAIPYVVASVGMALIGGHSDRTGERRWHVAGPMFLGATGLALCPFVTGTVPVLALLSVAALGIWGALGPFWTLPTAFLSGAGAAGGIALINSVGNLGGFAGPYLVGLVRNATQSFAGGLLALAFSLAAGGCLVLWVSRRGSVGENSEPCP